MWAGLRRRKLRLTPFRVEWRRIVESDCPFYQRLPEADRREIEGHIQVFLAEKKFGGCGGLELNDEIKVCIAAYACLLLLHRKPNYYPSLRTVLAYPSSYVVPTTRHIGSGVMEERNEHRLGESWESGAVVLAWDEVCRANRNPGTGHNVVLHEFAHQLDYEDGLADGCPLLADGESRSERKRRYSRWSQLMQAEYHRLCEQVQKGEATVLREYGATNPAEFFAVATECFFGKPQAMQETLPQLYEELKWYYQQDPARLNWHWPTIHIQ